MTNKRTPWIFNISSARIGRGDGHNKRALTEEHVDVVLLPILWYYTDILSADGENLSDVPTKVTGALLKEEVRQMVNDVVMKKSRWLV